MEFEALDKWWERTGVRSTPHEGLDCYCYECRNGKLKKFAERSLVPVMYAGIVAKNFNDLSGFSN